MGAILRALYPILKFFQILIVFINDLCFGIYNHFQERIIVPKPDSDLLLMSAVDLAAQVRERKLKSVKVISTFISRLKVVNPILNAVVEDNYKDAMKKAEEVDAYLEKLDPNSDEYKNLAETKPFLGVPFTIKDTFYVKGFHICCGLLAYKNTIAPEDAVLVKNMKDSGAILLCMTNVPEGGLWVEGNNPVYGRTVNPYDSRRATGGSSSGEGAVVAAAASVLSVGSDIGGSVRIPAGHCGIFGLKPTEDTVPKIGHWPPFFNGYRGKMMTAGPITRYAKDLGPLLRVFVGNEIADKQFQLSKPVDLKDIRFFTMEGTNTPFRIPIHRDMKDAVRKTAKHFEKKYSKPSYRLDLAKMHHSLSMYWVSLMKNEDRAAGSYGKLASGGKSEPSVFVELWKKLIGSPTRFTIPALIMMFLERFVHLSSDSERFYERKRDKLRAELLELLKEDGILIYPSWPTVAPYHGSQMCLPFTFPDVTGIFNTLRLPAIVAPVGLDNNGMPLSVQLVAAPNQDRLLIAAAQEIENAFGGWRIPGSHVSSSSSSKRN